MGGARKQYRQLGGESLLLRTLRVFDVHAGVDHIVVAAPVEDVSALASGLRDHDIRKLHAVVPGGASRQASVAAALRAAPDETDIVVVHDAVRPFVPPDRIEAVIETARREGAAALAIPVADTLRRSEGRSFGDTVERAGLVRMQTPQAFRRDWFVEAHRSAQSTGCEGTDDVALVQRIGRRVAVVDGSPINIKVTTPDDWVVAQAIWAVRERSGTSGT